MFGYEKGRWKKKRAHILKRDKYIDRVAKWYGKMVEANTVHHIYPVEKYPQYAWCDWNLISVSQETHNKLENRQTGELTELGKWLQSITPIPEGWQEDKDESKDCFISPHHLHE